MDKLDRALASCFSAEETWERSAVTLAAVPVAFCCAAETACTSLEHELPPAPGESFSLPGEEPAEAASAAPSPAQSTSSFARAAASVAWWPASACVSEASVALALASIASALATCWLACWTADGAVPDGTRMLEEPA